MKQTALIISSALLLAGCASTAGTGTAPVKSSQIPINDPGPINIAGLESVVGQNAATLKSLFGEPRLDVREAVGRKLQFSGKPCVLDTYLYQTRDGQETVTHVDARRSDGAEVDRASCINALRRR